MKFVKLSIILLSIISLTNSKSCGSKSKTLNNEIVGTWTLLTYEDNMERDEQEQDGLHKQILDLKENFSLTFKKDNTFERNGFAYQTEYGTWEVDEYNMLLYLRPNDLEGEDMLTIHDLKNKRMTLVINSKVDTSQIITKLTLQKQ